MNNVSEITVPSHKLAALVANIARLAKRAAKLGVPELAPKLEILGDAPIYAGKDDFDEPIIIGGTKVKLESSPIKVDGGWKVRAVVEHTSEGNVVFPVCKEVVAADYSKLAPLCDHCNTVRARNTTVIVTSRNGTTRQVGKSCLKAYTGIDPELALFAAAVARLDEAGWQIGEDEGYGGERWVPVEQVAVIAAAVIRQNGWVSRQKAESEYRTATADLVRSELRRFSPGFCESITDSDRALAKEAIEWAGGLSESTDNFERNLHTVAALGYIPGKFIGIAAYLTEACKRAAERVRRQQDAARSNHQGNIGDRLRNLSLTAVFSTSWETNFGVQFLTKFVDADGNVFVTKSSNSFEGTKPSDKVTGTVVGHDVRDGCKQTVLKRVTVK